MFNEEKFEVIEGDNFGTSICAAYGCGPTMAEDIIYYDLLLFSFAPENKNAIASLIRRKYNLSLKEVWDAMKSLPFLLEENLSEYEARLLKKEFQEIGAVVILK